MQCNAKVTLTNTWVFNCAMQIHRWDKDSSTSGLKHHGVNDAIADANRKLILVPIVFIVLRIWGTLRFVINAHFISDGDVMAWIVPLQVSLVSRRSNYLPSSRLIF